MTCREQIEQARAATAAMVQVDEALNVKVLMDLADRAEANIAPLLEANTKDLERMPESDPRYDRLLLSEDRIRTIAGDLRAVARMESPLGQVLEARKQDNGLQLQKVRVALGVVGVIYEARPNVTFDVFALCFRSGNVAVLKGGQDAWYSNQAIAQLIGEVLRDNGISREVMQLLPADRSAATELMNAVGLVDVLIPRGSQGLISSVRENSRVPVIETGAGVVHTYFDETADLEMGKTIVFNAKTRRVSVCNALECLLVHRDRLKDLPELAAPLAQKQVQLQADEAALAVLRGTYPGELLQAATEQSWGKEHLAYVLSVRTVANMDEALAHIAAYSTRHSEAILTTSTTNKARFFKEVDAAAVYANTSTAFTDGAQFGMGAEIGISTQKLHARGPMALPELTSYKWLVESDGKSRP